MVVGIVGILALFLTLVGMSNAMFRAINGRKDRIAWDNILFEVLYRHYSIIICNSL